LDDPDLFRVERAGGRHLQSVGASRYAVIEKAVIAAAGHHATAAEDHAFPVDPKSAALLGGPVATYAVLAEDGLDVAGEVDFRGGLSGQNPSEQK